MGTGGTENLARALGLPLLVRSLSQVRAEGDLLAVISPPNPQPEILDVLASFSIISVLTIVVISRLRNNALDWL